MQDIKGYEGLYAITSCGKVWSYRYQKFLKPSILKNGYLKVVLCKDNDRKDYLIHRLVGETYIPNPDNKPFINHKDENKQNNNVNNLEWVTAIENSNYGTRNERLSKPVHCVELDKTFYGVREAGRELHIDHSSIAKCCKNPLKTCGGYHWRYINE